MTQTLRIILAYASSIAAGIGIFLLIRRFGNSLVALGEPQALASAQAVPSVYPNAITADHP
jgi:hypothetical protein